jgi:iron(III) transport system permease protein
MRQPIAFLAAGLIALILGVFILYPVAAVLVKSFELRGAMSVSQLREITETALEALPPEERVPSVQRWAASATQKESMQAWAAAFELAGASVPWPVSSAFDEQALEVPKAVAVLPADLRQEIEANYPVSVVMLHKRIALAFKVRTTIGERAFDQLRSGKNEGYGLTHYLAVFKDSYLAAAALNSFQIAALAVLTTVPLAFFLSYAINAGLVPVPSIVRSILLLPLVAPPVLVAMAFIMLFGRRGLITHTLLDQTFGLIDADATNIYGAAGVILAQTLSFLPATLIVFDAALRKKDGLLTDAAMSLGASRWTIFREITLPLAWPGLKRAITLVFVMSLTDFGNPALLGQGTPVIAEIIYDEMTAFQNTPLAAALCMWMIGPSLLLYLLLDRIGRKKSYATTAASGFSDLVQPRAARLTATGIAAFVSLIIIAVYAVIVLGSVTRVWGTDWGLTLGYFNGAGVDVGHAGLNYGSSDRGLEVVWQSMIISALAAPFGALLGIMTAYVIERVKPPGANLLGFLVLVPAILPGIIFGIGYIAAFNLPFGLKSLSLLGSPAILVLNIAFGNLFVGVLTARAAFQRLDPAIDDAAESLGAGLVARFTQVTLPLLAPAFLLGAIYIFVDGLTTLSSVIFLVSSDYKLASVAIFNSANSAEYGYAAAKSVAILGLSLAAMAAAWQIERRRTQPSRTSIKPSDLSSFAPLAPVTP